MRFFMVVCKNIIQKKPEIRIFKKKFTSWGIINSQLQKKKKKKKKKTVIKMDQKLKNIYKGEVNGV